MNDCSIRVVQPRKNFHVRSFHAIFAYKIILQKRANYGTLYA